jgi:hypothetical protein
MKKEGCLWRIDSLFIFVKRIVDLCFCLIGIWDQINLVVYMTLILLIGVRGKWRALRAGDRGL